VVSSLLFVANTITIRGRTRLQILLLLLSYDTTNEERYEGERDILLILPSLYCRFNTSYFFSKPQVQYLAWSFDMDSTQWTIRHNERYDTTNDTNGERERERAASTVFLLIVRHCLSKPQVQYLGWSNDERVRRIILTTNETDTNDERYEQRTLRTRLNCDRSLYCPFNTLF
jgi:hypothetical protein